VFEGLQYAVLAKNVKGLKAAMSVVERVVIPCLRMISIAGAANALKADRSPTTKAAAYMANERWNEAQLLGSSQLYARHGRLPRDQPEFKLEPC